MGLRDRIATDRPRSTPRTARDGVAYYRRRLLEEVNLSEFAELSRAAAPRAPGARGRPHGLAARARCSRPPSARG